MSRPRNERPNFISVDIFRARQIASTMNNEEFGSWARKALDDMSIGCVGADVDPVVLECYQNAVKRMVDGQEANRKKYQNRKANAKDTETTAVVAVNGSKRNDQLIYGRFENVFLSQDEYNTLAKDFENIKLLNQTIEDFSSALEDGSATSTNHFATLSRWIARRKEWIREREQNSQKYETVSEHNARVLEQGRRIIHEMCSRGK